MKNQQSMKNGLKINSHHYNNKSQTYGFSANNQQKFNYIFVKLNYSVLYSIKSISIFIENKKKSINFLVKYMILKSKNKSNRNKPLLKKIKANLNFKIREKTNKSINLKFFRNKLKIKTAFKLKNTFNVTEIFNKKSHYFKNIDFFMSNNKANSKIENIIEIDTNKTNKNRKLNKNQFDGDNYNKIYTVVLNSEYYNMYEDTDLVYFFDDIDTNEKNSLISNTIFDQNQNDLNELTDHNYFNKHKYVFNLSVYKASKSSKFMYKKQIKMFKKYLNLIMLYYCDFFLTNTKYNLNDVNDTFNSYDVDKDLILSIKNIEHNRNLKKKNENNNNKYDLNKQTNKDIIENPHNEKVIELFKQNNKNLKSLGLKSNSFFQDDFVSLFLSNLMVSNFSNKNKIYCENFDHLDVLFQNVNNGIDNIPKNKHLEYFFIKNKNIYTENHEKNENVKNNLYILNKFLQNTEFLHKLEYNFNICFYINKTLSKYESVYEKIYNFFKIQLNNIYIKNFPLFEFCFKFSFMFFNKTINGFVEFMDRYLYKLSVNDQKNFMNLMDAFSNEDILPILNDCELKGVWIKFSGKIANKAGDKANYFLFRHGNYSITSKEIKTEYLFKDIKTDNGKIGLKIWLMY